MTHRQRFISYLVLALIILGLGTAILFLPSIKELASPEFLREYILGLGWWGYFAYVFIALLSIPLPIPSTPVALVGGYIYGAFVGVMLTIIGTTLGSLLMFYLVRQWGRSLVEKLVDSHHIQHFLHIFKRRGQTAALISYALPVFPSDALNIVLGLTKIRYRTFVLLVILGTIPRYVLVSLLGGDLYSGFSAYSVIVVLFCILFVLIAIFREKVKRFMFKELKELEQEVEHEVVKVEEEVEEEIRKIEQKPREEVETKVKKINRKPRPPRKK